MPRSPGDLRDIPTRELRRLGEDELVRLVVTGRMSNDATDKQRGSSAWGELVVREFDRVRQLVKAFCFPGQASVRVHPDDVDDAVQAAFMRLFNMFPNFEGTSVGEFRAALVTCVRYACMDFCRGGERLERGIGGSLDEQIARDDGTSRGRFEGELGERAAQQEQARQAARDQLERIAQAMSELGNEQMRAVLTMSWNGAAVEEIAAELDITPENVYQLRSRGTRKLLAALYDRDPGAEGPAAGQSNPAAEETDGDA